MAMKESKKKNKRKHKVFIVDDHSIVREGLSELINQEKDFTVCGYAESISKTLQTIADCNPDIVIVDLALEDGSGVRLIENLLYENPDLMILVLSMHKESIYAERSLKAGARGFLTKQEPSRKILTALREVLNGEIYISEKLSKQLLSRLAVKRTHTPDSPFDSLTNREMEIYRLIGEGERKREIAEKLNLSPKTVETYMENIRKKMKFKDTYAFVTHAVKNSMNI
jgi:DNA-binding NarL/FixJ family response regulator